MAQLTPDFIETMQVQYNSDRANYIGTDATASNKTQLLANEYDYAITAGGMFYFLAEPPAASTSPTLVFEYGSTPKIVAEFSFTGGGRVTGATRRVLANSEYVLYTYHEGDSDGFTNNVVDITQGSHWGTTFDVSTEGYNSLSGSVPSDRQMYYMYTKFNLPSWSAEPIRGRINAIKGANYTWNAWWE